MPEKTINDLDKSISKIHSYFEEQGIVPRMHEQVKSTNGRVKKLELWKAYLVGAWCVASFVSIAVMPTFFYLYLQSVKAEINSSMHNDIDEYITDNYELND